MDSFAQRVASLVLSKVNLINGVRDSVYLDTNAWSQLAKGDFSWRPLVEFCAAKGYFICLAKFQLVELSKSKGMEQRLIDLLENVPVTIVDRLQNEFDGNPWHLVRIEMEERVHLTSKEQRNAFEWLLNSEELDSAQRALKDDSQRFGLELDEAIRKIPPIERSWTVFDQRASRWIRSRLENQGKTFDASFVDDRSRFIGLRLCYGVLFAKYLMNRENWGESDYVDFLQTADMAYARIVVTERNLAHYLKEAMKRGTLTGPLLVTGLDWLLHPRDGD